jgi:hypothetical protein
MGGGSLTGAGSTGIGAGIGGVIPW